MIYHASSVVRGVKRALVVVDLPFGTYQGNSKEALVSSIRIMKETGAHAVKLEGGQQVAESIERILSAGIPVMGHLGLTPQAIHKFGTYVVRAKEEEEARRLLEDAKLIAGDRMLRHSAGENSCQASRRGDIEHKDPDNWHWGWTQDRWTGTCPARHAGNNTGIFTKVLKKISQSSCRDQGGSPGIYKRCANTAVPE